VADHSTLNVSICKGRPLTSPSHVGACRKFFQRAHLSPLLHYPADSFYAIIFHLPFPPSIPELGVARISDWHMQTITCYKTTALLSLDAEQLYRRTIIKWWRYTSFYVRKHHDYRN